MEAVKEITQWKVDYTAPNHIYLLDGNKALAYMPFGQGRPHYFSKPIAFDRRGRTFEKVKPNPFNAQPSRTKSVQGSNGQVYQVDIEHNTCTCMGFTFRGYCKHTKMVA